MAKQETAVVTEKIISMGNFLNFPQTQKFLDDNLRERRSEFVSNLLSLIEADKNLSECEPKALMMCALNATALNLPLNKNLGFAYIIPYKGVPTFQIGYKGLIQLAIRTGAYQFLNACEIRENEINRNKITGEITFNGDKPEAKIIGYLSFLKLQTGFSASLYMTEAEIEAHALRFSAMYRSDNQYKTCKSKWSDAAARPKMALKTVLKGLLATYGVLTAEMEKAFNVDNEAEADNNGSRGGEWQEAVEAVQTDTPEQVEIKEQPDPDKAAKIEDTNVNGQQQIQI